MKYLESFKNNENSQKKPNIGNSTNNQQENIWIRLAFAVAAVGIMAIGGKMACTGAGLSCEYDSAMHKFCKLVIIAICIFGSIGLVIMILKEE